MSNTCRCTRCGDVIGIYEPLVLVDHRGAVRTSFAAGAAPAELGQAQYHAACFEESFGLDARGATAGPAARGPLPARSAAR